MPIRWIILSALLLIPALTGITRAADRPNILWITSEDNGPELGCYGDTYADTPNIDELASMGLRYEVCWSNAPVCAPARTTLISGMYPASLGAENMRSLLPMPANLKMYPQYLREAGYYCTNNSKEDYNLDKPGEVWDLSNNKAHWKNCPAGKPFFSIFNHTISHESQLRKRPHEAVHDPAGVQVPPYHPDTPETRQDWAQYYDKLTEMDRLVGKNVKELRDAGQLENTIIFYYGDHGSGMPRHKRWPYNTGLHVPLIVVIPEKYRDLAPADYQAGGASKRLVSFVDFAPTLLSLIGEKPPAHMQGKAFAGPHATENPDYIFGFRGRMDERPDFVRSVRNERYVYVRHFQPQRPCGQFVHYMFQTPTTRKWYELHLEGKLTPAQDQFWIPKPVEELFDLQSDPHEVQNLAEDPAHEEVLKQFRIALFQQMQKTVDLGVMPEAEMHRRSDPKSPYDLQRAGKLLKDYDMVLLAAAVASGIEDVPDGKVREAFESDEPCIRYWACQWTLIHGADHVTRYHSDLLDCLKDESPSVQIAAAEALGQYGEPADLKKVLPLLLKLADLNQTDVYTVVSALNAIDYLDQKAAPIRKQLGELPEKVKVMPARTDSYAPRLLEKILADLDGAPLP
ncbi:MAG: sulfatase-like hydrolase/transferase [Planctomycetaceae bacterium]|nr:sulfatase-like hydrolase/transferase [Planctomycetaceae bacterium]